MGPQMGAEADTSQSRRCELNQGRIIPGMVFVDISPIWGWVNTYKYHF